MDPPPAAKIRAVSSKIFLVSTSAPLAINSKSYDKLGILIAHGVLEIIMLKGDIKILTF